MLTDNEKYGVLNIEEATLIICQGNVEVEQIRIYNNGFIRIV